MADKLMKQASDMPRLTAPEDKTVTSLYVGGVEDDITERDLRWVWLSYVHDLSPPLAPPLCRSHFYQFGEIQGIHIAQKQKCAFVTFSTRDAAERAADGSFNKTVIRGTGPSRQPLNKGHWNPSSHMVVHFLPLRRGQPLYSLV